MVGYLVVICDQTIIKKDNLKIDNKNYIIGHKSRLINLVKCKPLLFIF